MLSGRRTTAVTLAATASTSLRLGDGGLRGRFAGNPRVSDLERLAIERMKLTGTQTITKQLEIGFAFERMGQSSKRREARRVFNILEKHIGSEIERLSNLFINRFKSAKGMVKNQAKKVLRLLESVLVT